MPAGAGEHAAAPSRDEGRFVILGDLQRRSRIEFWRERNERETERIFRLVLAERPEFVVLLGDLVFRGSSARDWERFDALLAPWLEAGIEVLPILGNHDYWLNAPRALALYFRRFPHLHHARWYTRTRHGLGLVFLDSNRLHARGEDWRAQQRWLERELGRLDDDPGVRGTLVFVHHPPFTNSTVTGDSAWVKRDLVPLFHRASKTLAMISGHVHSYERFIREGKFFLVAGGGGGPRVRLASGARRRHEDDLCAGPPLRLLHFLVAHVRSGGLEIVAKGLDKVTGSVLPFDRFHLLAMADRRTSVP